MISIVPKCVAHVRAPYLPARSRVPCPETAERIRRALLLGDAPARIVEWVSHDLGHPPHVTCIEFFTRDRPDLVFETSAEKLAASAPEAQSLSPVRP